MKVAVPWLQHSQRFGHCALSQTVCNRKSEINAFVEKKTGFDGNRTLIQGGFCAWCRAGSIFAQDISNKSYNVKNLTKVKSLRIALLIPTHHCRAPVQQSRLTKEEAEVADIVRTPRCGKMCKLLRSGRHVSLRL